jgi:transcriptional regulator with XRE-family HTH domain
MRATAKTYTELGHRIADLVGPQKKLAKILGLHRSTVGKKLQGRVPFTTEELVKVAQATNVTVRTLFELRGTDINIMKSAREMHMHAPQAFDKIVNAYWHNRRLLTELGDIAERLMKETEPEYRRGDHIFSAGVGDDVVVPTPTGVEEGTDEG